MKFSALNLDNDLLKGIADNGYVKCTPVQEQSLPESLAGKDVIVQSQTGTGKTAVFIITIFNGFLSASGKRPRGPRALVMAPTRELAVQLDTEAKKLAKHLPFRSVAIYGGVGYDKQVSALKRGVDLVVATPGRMIDLYKSKELTMNDIEIFIIDEADRMFDMGFAPDIRYIANRLPKSKPRQTMLFSATIDDNVRRLASRYMKPDPVLVEIEPEQVTVDEIDQKVLYPSNEEKIPVLMALLNKPDMERAIIFTNMKRTAEMLEWKLVGNGFPAKLLTGDVTQSKRQRIIDDMKSGKVNILVATDVVARGLHIEDVSHIINFDLPQEAASYVHRIGRTARAGKKGTAYSLVCEDHAWNLPDIEKFIDHKIEVEWIEDSELVRDKAGTYRMSHVRKKDFERGERSGNRPRGGNRVSSPAPRREKPKKGPAMGAEGARPKKGTDKRAQSKGKKAAPEAGPEKTGAKRPSGSRPNDRKKGKRPAKTKEDRLSYYKKKYGEDFSPAEEKSGGKAKSRDKSKAPAKEKPRTGVLKRVMKVFGKKS